MIVNYSKTTRISEQSGNYDDYVLAKNLSFCCDSFKTFSKKFPSWSYESGHFTIVDTITYDGNTAIPISFCPFCGEHFEYEEIHSKKTNQ